jgi:hypothetical protein
MAMFSKDPEKSANRAQSATPHPGTALDAPPITPRAQKTVEPPAPAAAYLHRGTKIIGNITAPKVIAHDGAIFEGHCSMGQVSDGGRKIRAAS